MAPFDTIVIASRDSTGWPRIRSERAARSWRIALETCGLGHAKGVVRFDGKRITSYGVRDGLVGNWVEDIEEDSRGNLWFATAGGGISLFDGLVFQKFQRQDGLVSDLVTGITEDRRGNIWITTGGGITRYRPSTGAPGIALTDVISDRRYGPVTELNLPVTQTYLAFEFSGRSLSMHWEAIAYVYQLEGADEKWKTTRLQRVEYSDLPEGQYTFKVKAVDRDLNYSEIPATVSISIRPSYEQIAWKGGLAVVGLGLILTALYGYRKQRELRRIELLRVEQMEQELQTAHDMQMSLMPKERPTLAGFSVAGVCVPASHVGGDFWQYFLKEDKLAVCLADVTGKAMEAAIPVVMFSGILESEIQHGIDPRSLFSRLNRTLSGTLDSRTFVCFAMGEIDLSTRVLRLCNAACPYPYHYNAQEDEIREIQADSYPLGIRSDTAYDTVEVQLQGSDYLVFVSDGITETENADGEIFGYDRTTASILEVCRTGSTPETVIEGILEDVNAFKGSAIHSDDMTCVVLKTE